MPYSPSRRRGARVRLVVGSAAALLALGAVAGCGTDDTPAPGTDGKGIGEETGEETGMSTAKGPAKDSVKSPVKDPVKDCADADCEVEVRKGLTLTFEADVDPRSIEFSDVSGGTVTVESRGSGTFMRSTVGGSGAAQLNKVLVTVRSADGDRAVVRISRVAE